MEVFKLRQTPVPTVVTQRWYAKTYRRELDGVMFPTITQVPESGAVPEHGVYQGPEGQVVVNKGDIIAVGPSGIDAGDYGSYSFLDFNSQFETV